ncbi:triggering receptor expressed on myeloid cells 1 [Diceros bicornis minor]|uniref:triggering receptor expressed on myeloid cells 1 n=1 Tax=Diceros bicornis minor TaxID=77932 RepID=UPI0026F3281C|nr:triggering receptor expressed on myeloid cells 1 [Diceros bicornis minor]
MRKARLRGLLWMLFVSELQVAAEEKKTLKEGQTLSLDCVYTKKYSYSQKAWQRVTDGGKVETLAITNRTSRKSSQEPGGRYFLEDDSVSSAVRVRMTNVQVSDSGRYQCVIYLPHSDPEILSSVHLVVTKGSSATPVPGKTPTQNRAQIPTHPPTTTEAQNKFHTSPRIVTQGPPKSTAGVSPPGLGVNPTNMTYITRTFVFSIVVPVVCGLLSKSLVFTVLFVVTQRSFEP